MNCFIPIFGSLLMAIPISLIVFLWVKFLVYACYKEIRIDTRKTKHVWSKIKIKFFGVNKGVVQMNIYKVDFEGIYPKETCLILCAENKQQALKLANETILHDSDWIIVKKVCIQKPAVIEYMDGDYN